MKKTGISKSYNIKWTDIWIIGISEGEETMWQNFFWRNNSQEFSENSRRHKTTDQEVQRKTPKQHRVNTNPSPTNMHTQTLNLDTSYSSYRKPKVMRKTWRQPGKKDIYTQRNKYKNCSILIRNHAYQKTVKWYLELLT